MSFDLQAHRGGLGLTVENTMPAFVRALEVGVSTLEFDVQITADGHAVVAHDRDPQPEGAVDTGPAFPGDPMFPYVRDETYLVQLTLDQVRTIDVGSRRLLEFPGQELAPGARMPLLVEVLELARPHRDLGLNIEFKIEVIPGRTASAEEFVEVVVPLLRAAELLDRVTIQSFDWGALALVREAEPGLGLVPLADGRHTGDPEAAAPWLGGVAMTGPDDYVPAAVALGAVAVSPHHRLATEALVAAAHDAGLQVLPWTVDDPARLQELLELGVDGVITNRPDLARDVLAARGIPLPPSRSVRRA